MQAPSMDKHQAWYHWLTSTTPCIPLPSKSKSWECNFDFRNERRPADNLREECSWMNLLERTWLVVGFQMMAALPWKLSNWVEEQSIKFCPYLLWSKRDLLALLSNCSRECMSILVGLVRLLGSRMGFYLLIYHFEMAKQINILLLWWNMFEQHSLLPSSVKICQDNHLEWYWQQTLWSYT